MDDGTRKLVEQLIDHLGRKPRDEALAETKEALMSVGYDESAATLGAERFVYMAEKRKRP